MSHAHVTRDTRVSHADVTRGVTHLSRSPVPSRPDPTRNTPTAAWSVVGRCKVFCMASVCDVRVGCHANGKRRGSGCATRPGASAPDEERA